MTERPPRVKICGITRLADAELAVELGAWALGMIFFDGSPRACSPAEAVRIAATLRRRVDLCGVFVNAPLDHVAGRAEEVGLSLIQLHGNEGPAYCGEVARRTGARVIKAAQVSLEGDIRDLERFHVDYHLVDARGPVGRESLRGGTGRTFDWSLLEHRRSAVPLVLSGGLHAGNVADAVARTRPWAVDTASGTEAAPGIKDHRRLHDFFVAVVGADRAPAADGAELPASASVTMAAGERA